MVVRLAQFLLFVVVQYAAVKGDGLSSYKLNDGHEIPAVALGTSLGHLSDGTRILPTNHSLARAVQWALEAGYKHIDTASLYRTEYEVGLGVRDFLRDNNADRRDLYITTKAINCELTSSDPLPSPSIIYSFTSSVIIDDESPFYYTDTISLNTRGKNSANLTPTTLSCGDSENNDKARSIIYHDALLPFVEELTINLVFEIIKNSITGEVVLPVKTNLWNNAHERYQVIRALKSSLEELQMDYVDLYLVHYPMAYHENGSISETDYLETWKGMEDAKDLRLATSIGVSNFNLTQMQRLWDNSRIKPAVLQIEVNPTLTQEALTNWCKDHGVVVMAYTPFGAILGRKGDAPPPRADHPVLIRIANKYNKTVPQILLRYLLDRQLVAIPRSTNKERIEQNIDIMDFSLTAAEEEELSKFNSNYMLRTPAKWYSHPEFPFQKKNLTDSEIQYIIEHSKED